MEVFSCEYFEILKSTYFAEHLRVTASVNMVMIISKILATHLIGETTSIAQSLFTGSTSDGFGRNGH